MRGAAPPFDKLRVTERPFGKLRVTERAFDGLREVTGVPGAW